MKNTIPGIICLVLTITIIWGYVLNIIAIVHTIDLPVSGMFILRCIGIFVAPLGAILGLFC